MILILIYFVTRAWAQPAVLEENSINGLTGGAGMILTGSITHEEKPYEYHSNIMSPNHYLVNHLDFHTPPNGHKYRSVHTCESPA